MSETADNILSGLLFFSIIASIIVGFSLIFFVSINDYANAPIIDIADTFVSKGIVNQSFVDGMENVANYTQNFPSWLDKLFFLFLATFTVSLLVSAYRVKRSGYFNLFGTIVIFSMFILFISTYYLEVSEWIKNLLFSAIPTITPEIPIFSWYLNNAGVYNTILLFLTIIISFLDLDFSRFNSRKEKEVINDEI